MMQVAGYNDDVCESPVSLPLSFLTSNRFIIEIYRLCPNLTWKHAHVSINKILLTGDVQFLGTFVVKVFV